MAEVLIAPYLPLTEQVQVSGWTLLPILSADDPKTVKGESELIPAELQRPVRRLVDAYRVRDEAGLGVLIAPRGEGIGAPVKREAMRPLSGAPGRGCIR